MSARRIAVLRTGTANLASVLAGFGRLGAECEVVEEPAALAGFERLVLPGVGTMAAAMQRLEQADLIAPLTEWVEAGRPFLAVCLGMQLLFEGSEESPDAVGLKLAPGVATRFGGELRVPQLGWNDIAAAPGCRLLRSGDVYFANSYRIETPPPGWAVATCDYGGRFVAAMERGPQLACQFHPELSGRFGLELLTRWLTRGDEEVGGC